MLENIKKIEDQELSLKRKKKNTTIIICYSNNV